MSWKSAGFALLVIGLLVISLYRAKDGARESAGEIADLEKKIERALAEKKALLNTLDRKAARHWLEEYARTELGMDPVRAEQFVNEVNIDALLGTPQIRAPSSLRKVSSEEGEP
ncbi:MAG: cell division protein FtsL [Pseudomonadota bacterium]